MKAIYKRLKPLKSLFKPKNHRVKVHFLVCGVQKSGTTSFDYYLRQHPQICMPSNLKEVHSSHASQSGQEFTNIIVISSLHAPESLMDFLIT